MRAQGAAVSSEPGCRVVPKKEVAINPINPRGELALRQRKSSLLCSFLNRFMPRLAGSIRREILSRVVLFSIFYFNIFVQLLFGPASKIMLM